jgi:hypothetical protein
VAYAQTLLTLFHVSPGSGALQRKAQARDSTATEPISHNLTDAHTFCVVTHVSVSGQSVIEELGDDS